MDGFRSGIVNFFDRVCAFDASVLLPGIGKKDSARHAVHSFRSDSFDVLFVCSRLLRPDKSLELDGCSCAGDRVCVFIADGICSYDDRCVQTADKRAAIGCFQ